jgi:murein DD-endopeptidase MepM/ murein hydrolase activator NlpD
MDTEKVTILLISNDDEEVKSYKISKNLIINFKKYLYISGAVLSIALVVFFSVFAYSLKVSVDNSGLNGELGSLNQKLQSYDSMQIHQKLNKIDNNLSMIDGYLHSRGVLETGNAGGEPGTGNYKIHSNIIKIDRFEKQSVIFYNTIREIPLGYPYGGPKSSDYGFRRNPFGGVSTEFHAGIDLKGAPGDPIYATGDGIVSRCDFYGGYGNAVVIDHKSGYQSLYGHLSGVNVTDGQQVKAGDIIGFLGSTGRSTGPHLHYEIRKNGEDIDPEPFLNVY